MKEEKKMTLDEYIDKYSSKPHNNKQIRATITLVLVLVAVILITALTLLTLKVYEMNQYVGYGFIGISVLVFIFGFIVPVCKIKNLPQFKTVIRRTNVNAIKKYNQSIRHDIADKMIDIDSKIDGISIYHPDHCYKLAVARHNHDEKALLDTLVEIYNKDVKKACNKLITDTSLKIAGLTALSQSDVIDTALVTTLELNLVKKIMYLYGFRPSERRLLKAYKSILVNSLVAYSVSTATPGLVTKLSADLPVVGKIVGSAAQGAVNAMFCTKIGIQTKLYLKKEFKLQEILDGIEIDDGTSEVEQAEIIEEVNKAVKEKNNHQG